jgi:hypothetical protein
MISGNGTKRAQLLLSSISAIKGRAEIKTYTGSGLLLSDSVAKVFLG